MSAAQGLEDWSLLCHYDWVCRLLKYSGSKELWGPLAPDNCEDKGPDCGSALTLQIVKMFGALHAEHSDTRDRSMVANYCWCDRLSLKSFTHAATDVCRAESPGHKWSTHTMLSLSPDVAG